MREQAYATLNISLDVECPNCDNNIDLMTCHDDELGFLNEEGSISKRAFSDKAWSDGHKNFHLEGITCNECKTKFDVKEILW